MLTKVLLILSVAVLGTVSNELPTYINTCSRNDSNMNECVKTNANLAIETLQNGDVSLNLPKLYGIQLFDSVTVNPLKELPFSLVMKNGRAYGIENARVKDAKIDLVQRHVELLFTSPQVIWQCTYEAEVNSAFGNFSQENSAYNVTFNNGEYLYQFDYELKDKNGEEYIDITSHRFDFKNVEIIHKLENIESNLFIHAFWEQTRQYFPTPEVRQPCSDLVTKYINAFFKVFPYNKIFKS